MVSLLQASVRQSLQGMQSQDQRQLRQRRLPPASQLSWHELLSLQVPSPQLHMMCPWNMSHAGLLSIPRHQMRSRDSVPSCLCQSAQQQAAAQQLMPRDPAQLRGTCKDSHSSQLAQCSCSPQSRLTHS